MITFWWLLMMAVMVWYSTVTVYVAIRGSVDVKHMLRALEEKRDGKPPGVQPRGFDVVSQGETGDAP